MTAKIAMSCGIPLFTHYLDQFHIAGRELRRCLKKTIRILF